MIEIGRCAHGREGGVRATLDELRAHVPLPHLDHGLLLGCEINFVRSLVQDLFERFAPL